MNNFTSIRSLVVPGIELTIATFFFKILLIKVLFPTFGFPTIEILIPSFAICNFEEDSMTLFIFKIMVWTYFLDVSNKLFPILILQIYLLILLRIKCKLIQVLIILIINFSIIQQIFYFYLKGYPLQFAFKIIVNSLLNHVWPMLLLFPFCHWWQRA